MKGLMTFEEMVEEGFNEGKSVGLEESREETRIETARRLFRTQLSAHQISECTGIPLEKVLELQNKVVKVVTE